MAEESAAGTVATSSSAAETTVPDLARAHAGPIKGIAVGTRGGRQLAATAGEDSALVVWDLQTLEPVLRIVGDGRTAYCVAIGEVDDRVLLASGWGDWTVRIHDLDSGALVGTPLAGHRAGSSVTAVTIAEVQGRPLLFSADTVGAIHSWDLATGEHVGVPLSGHTAGLPVFALASTSLGDTPVLASGSRDGSVVLWNLVTRQPVWKHDQGPWGTPDVASVTSVAPWQVRGAGVIAAGSADGAFMFLDLADGTDVMTRTDAVPGFTALIATMTSEGAHVLASGHDDGSLRFWEDAQQAPRVITSAQSRVEAMAFAPAADGPLPEVVVGGEDGRLWSWDPLSDVTTTGLGAAPDQVDWLADDPGDVDLLQREPLAAALARRLMQIRERDPRQTFLVHLDGAWGSGKSTILNFLRRSLEPEWIVVDFDAWRQSRVGPPWWALLVALRTRLVADLPWSARTRLRVSECFARIRRTGAPYLFAMALLVITVVGVLVLLGPPSWTWEGAGDIAKAIAAVAAALGTLWAGGLLASRFLLWDSAQGAVVYEQTKPNPMESVADHFAWLLARAGRPVAFFLDDLDRCPGEYVVDLLEALQTLIRDAPRRGVRRGAITIPVAAPHFVVAADGSWLRTAYEVRYEQFRESIAEPGRPLGYLFLAKLFQLTVTVPTIGNQEQSAYLASLLRVQADVRSPETEVATVRAQIRGSATSEEVIDALQGASPAARRALAPEAVERLSDPTIEAATEHALQAYASLLEPNPRAMKRFLNAYAVARVVLTLENALVPSDALARWTILRSRWPSLADLLSKDPELVTSIGPAAPAPPDIDDELRRLMSSAQVHQVVHSPRAGPLTPALVRACIGGSAHGTRQSTT